MLDTLQSLTSAVANNVSLYSLIDISVRIGCLMLLATLAVMLLRKSSAAVRHLVWASAFFALLLLPVLSLALPEWQALPNWSQQRIEAPVDVVPEPEIQNAEVETPTAVSAIKSNPFDMNLQLDPNWDSEPVEEHFELAAAPIEEVLSAASMVPVSATLPTNVSATAEQPRVATTSQLPAWILIAWAIGCGLLFVRLIVSRLILGRLVASAVPVAIGPIADEAQQICDQLGIRRAVNFYQTSQRETAMTWGLLRTYVLLPASAIEWNSRRLRTVLLHELAHVKQYDTVTHVLSQVVCALYWFHPLVWLAAWRLHVEREQACDNRVLQNGVKASDYAEDLLSLLATRTVPCTALAIARRSELEGRLRAIVGDRVNRRGLNRAALVGTLIVGLLSTSALAMLQPQDEATRLTEESLTTSTPADLAPASLRSAEAGSVELTLGNENRTDFQPTEQPVAEPVTEAGEKETVETVAVHCVDEKGKPVDGAEVYLFQHDGEKFQQFGPFTSDDEGKVDTAHKLYLDKLKSFSRVVYARVPGDLVGFIQKASQRITTVRDDMIRVKMRSSRSIEGKVNIPDGFDPAQVTVRVRSITIPLPNGHQGRPDTQYRFDRGFQYPGIDTALPKIFETHPDSKGRFYLHDIPSRCELFLDSKGEGLASGWWSRDSGRFDKSIEFFNEVEAIVSGRVFAPDGKPAAGLKVMGPSYVDNPEQLSITDDQGQFMIRGLHASAFRLSVYDPKQRWIFFTEERVHIRSGQHLTLAVNMQKGVIIGGQVADPMGQPVQGVVVHLSGKHGLEGKHEVYADFETNATGQYQFCVLGDSSVKLEFRKIPAGYARPYPTIVKQLEIKADQKELKDLNFTLQRAVDLKIKPKPKSRLRSKQAASAASSKPGREPAPQPTELIAQANETPGETSESKSADGSKTEQTTQTLDPISGTVVLGVANKPVAGATVTLRRRPFRYRPKSPVLATTTTDERGQFTFKNVPLPESEESSTADRSERVYPLDLIVTKPGHSIRWKRLLRGQADAQIKLRRESTFAGILKDETGQPVVNATVRVAHMMSLNTISKIDIPHGHTPNTNGDSFLDIADGPVGIQATTDGNGRFLLRDLPSRVGLILQVNDKRYMPLKIYAATTDEKLPQIPIAASNSQADRSTAAAIMTERGRKVTYASIQRSGAEHEIQRGIHLTVKVVDAKTGKPVEKAGVFVANDWGAFQLSGRFKDYPTTKNGTVEFYHQTAGRLNVVVKPPNETTLVGMTEIIDLKPGQDYQQTQTVKLEHGSVVTGKIVDKETGVGVEGAQVYCNRSHHDHHTVEADKHVKNRVGLAGPTIVNITSAVTDEQGNYRIVVPSGKNRLTLGHLPEGYKSAKPDADDPHKQTTVMVTAKDRQPIENINFKVTRKPSFRVDFVGPDGRPVAVNVTGKGLLPGGYRQPIKTEAQPTNSFMYFPDERTKALRLIARSADGSLAAMTHFKNIKTSGSQQKMQLFRVASVTGVVTDKKAGDPIEGASVSLSISYEDRTGQHMATARTDKEGRYEFKGLIPDARYSLGFYARGFVDSNSIHTPFETKAGEKQTVNISLRPNPDPNLVDIKPFKLPDLKGLSPAEALKKLTAEYDKSYKDYRQILKKQTNSATRKHLAEKLKPTLVFVPAVMEIADNNRGTDVELQALLWLCKANISVAPLRPLRAEAAARILRDYEGRNEIADAVPSIVYNSPERYEVAQQLMKNPHAKVRTQAYMTAADMLTQRYRYQGQQEPLRVEAIKFYKKVAADDAGISHWQYGTLGELAKRKLFSLEHLIVGKKAPELKGTDLAGQPMKLADFRGKVVLIHYWQENVHDFVRLKKTLHEYSGKPLVVVGVNGEEKLDDAIARAKKLPLQVRHWHDPQNDISSRWCRSLPTTQVIGHDGTIYRTGRNSSYETLEDFIDKALAAMEKREQPTVSATATSNKKVEQATVAKPTDEKSADTSIAFTCQDQQGEPVAGAEVYVFQHDGKRFQQYGPLKSDDKGQVANVPEMLSDKAGSYDRWVYARVPGKLVGVTRSVNWKNGTTVNDEGQVKLYPSQVLKGQVKVPEGVNPESVTVRVITLWAFYGPEEFDFDSWNRSHRFPGLDNSLPKIFECQPKADGSFQLTDIPVRSRTFLQTVGDGLAQTQWYNKERTINEPVSLLVKREGVITGRVLSPEGQPLANVEVGARISERGRLRLGYSSEFRMFTNDKGEYRLEHLPETEVHLYAKAEGQELTFRPLQDLLAKSGETLNQEIKMERGTILRGRVTDSDGKPVQYAAISAVAEIPIGLGLDHCRTDAEGKYEMRVPAGIVQLYFNSLPKGFEYPNPQAFKVFDAEPDEAEINDLNVTLQRKGDEKKQSKLEAKKQPTKLVSYSKSQSSKEKDTVAVPKSVVVHCVNQKNDPVAGAEVYVFQYDGQRYQQFGPFTSDERGQVVSSDRRLVDKPDKYGRWIYARVPGRLVGATASARNGSEDVFNADGRVEMWPSRTVSGSLQVPTGFDPTKVSIQIQSLIFAMDQDGQPRGDFARIIYPGLKDVLPTIFNCQPDAKGHFQLNDVPINGQLFLATVGKGLGEAQWKNEGDTFDDPIQLTVEREAVLTGVVRTPDGTPISGVNLSANLMFQGPSKVLFATTFSSKSDEEGRFTINGLPKSKVTVTVEDPGKRWVVRPQQNLLVQPGEQTAMSVNLEEGALVSGQVFDTDGNPLKRTRLWAGTVADITALLGNTTTDDNGRYQIRLPSGKATLRLTVSPDVYRVVDVQEGQANVDDLDFTLQRNPLSRLSVFE